MQYFLNFQLYLVIKWYYNLQHLVLVDPNYFPAFLLLLLPSFILHVNLWNPRQFLSLNDLCQYSLPWPLLLLFLKELMPIIIFIHLLYSLSFDYFSWSIIGTFQLRAHLLMVLLYASTETIMIHRLQNVRKLVELNQLLDLRPHLKLELLLQHKWLMPIQ